MRVRRLSPCDVLCVVEAVREFKGRIVCPEHAREFLREDRHHVVVAEIDGDLAGYLLAYRLDRIDRESAKMFIYEIDVAEAHRRKAVGKALVESILKIAEEGKMMSSFVLTNRSNEAAVSLYRSTGGRISEDDGLVFTYPIGETLDPERDS